MPTALVARRGLLRLAVIAPVAGLAACMGGVGSYSVEEGVRRLLTLSSQRAFGRLIRPGGFYDDQLTRLAVPDLAGDRSGAVLAAILRTNAVRTRIAVAINDLAVDAADRATPILLDAIRRMSFADALAVLRGGPTAATDLLARETEGAVLRAMFPEFSTGLRGDAFEILSAALGASTGFDYNAMADMLARQAGQAIFRAIGREEADIRRNPRATGDPVLIALLGG
ncbi:DUF4197 domain-containing protein [Sphingomonas sp.]|uniref:DUF4197 domain-containing protein n=1 Tax=Sphingomonas sp. TaxID=28214 RepID=UPI001EB2D192|nr:DUF4197 domain-containing protein [Sphingomonas sp.]MBX3593302.1 DUF4197 domain-containing protein [Sphingomonas sp.]